jgi:hypothetical protein
MRRLLILAALVALGFVVARSRRAVRTPEPDSDPWSTKPPVAAEAPEAPEAPEAQTAAWVDPVNGECPPTHPVKAKLSSGIYHLPGMLAYARTHPDRCYLDATAAEADGLRPAKR